MKAFEIINDVLGDAVTLSNPYNVDKLVWGDKDREVNKIAVCHIATPDVIRAAAEWGADMMITHEPTFYNHLDEFDSSKLAEKKRSLLNSAGFCIYRYHDAMHLDGIDEVNSAFIDELELKGKFDGKISFISDTPISAVALAKAASERLDIRHIRIVGDGRYEGHGIRLALGMPGGACFREFLENDEWSIIVCGENCEWSDCEPVRDAVQMGAHKAILVMGHADREKYAMKTFASRIDKKYGAAEAKYFDCGKIYSYVD